MNTIITLLKNVIFKPTAQGFHERSKLSLEVFQKTVEDLEQLNSEAVAHKTLHQGIIEASTREILEIDTVLAKNSKVISKINEIIA